MGAIGTISVIAALALLYPRARDASAIARNTLLVMVAVECALLVAYLLDASRPVIASLLGAAALVAFAGGGWHLARQYRAAQ